MVKDKRTKAGQMSFYLRDTNRLPAVNRLDRPDRKLLEIQAMRRSRLFYLAPITFISIFWACTLRTPSAVQAPPTPVAALPTPKPAASPTPTRESMFAAPPRAISAP